jgi:hypothetical protein
MSAYHKVKYMAEREYANAKRLMTELHQIYNDDFPHLDDKTLAAVDHMLGVAHTLGVWSKKVNEAASKGIENEQTSCV